MKLSELKFDKARAQFDKIVRDDQKQKQHAKEQAKHRFDKMSMPRTARTTGNAPH